MTMCNPWELNQWQRNKRRQELQDRLTDLQNWQPSERAVYAEHSYKRDEIERLQREMKQIKEGRR